MPRHLFLLVALMLTCIVHAQYQHSTEIDALFTDWNDIGSPGCAIGVIQNGELVYTNGYGSADLEHNVPLRESSVFYMASVSKQFVTFCILLLEEQGKVDLDAPIQTYLPDFPDYGSPLTIRHFVHHTSGVRDYLTLMSLKGMHYMDDTDPEEVYELIKRQSSLNFTPGDKYLYSNSCYFMLAMIVKEVTGKSIKVFAEEHMFGPLGMENTHFHDDHTHLIKNRAFSYSPRDGGGYNNLIMRFDQVGSGGLYSCVKDVFLWDQNFYDNKLGKGGQEIMEKMHTEGKLSNGESIDYAFGISNGDYNGLRTVSHGGALAGYRTYFLRFPEQNTSIIFLANRSDANSGTMSRRIADIVLKDEFEEAELQQAGDKTDSSTPSEYLAFDGSSLTPYTGEYVIQPGVDFVAEIIDDSLQITQNWNGVSYKILPTAEHVFVIPDSEVSFTFGAFEDDLATTVHVDQGGSITECKRKTEFDINALDIEQYVGTYYSKDLDCNYVIYIDNDVLMIRKPRQTPTKLSFQDEDTCGDDRSVYYITRRGNDVDGFVLDAGRVENLVFVRQQ